MYRGIGHSYIDRYDFQGAGFVLNPFGMCYKKYEDSSGNAYIGYANCSMYPDGSGTLYDLGVCVGKSGAHKVFRLSQGVDAFTWYLLNAFIFTKIIYHLKIINITYSRIT